ncbi:hypothetical protein cypCar_00029803 [Cyprinus carpio]|nr:hypothetical protein cypCar_00029803 [Cyprinus carpio]
MSLTVSQGEGMTVITVASNPKSRWPVLCQILGSLCYGPVSIASQEMEEKLTDTQRVIGIVQIVVAVMNLVLGCFGIIFFFVTTSANSIVLSVLQLCVAISFCVLTIKSLCKKGGSAKDMEDKLTDTHTALGTVQIMVGVMNITVGFFGFVFAFWIGGVFLVVGIMCVLAVMFPHPRLLVITVALNVVSAALAITTAVLYSIDLAMGSSLSCYREHYYYSSNNDWPAHKKSNLSQTIKRMGAPGKLLCILMLLLHKSSQQQVFNDEQTLNLPENYAIDWMKTLDDNKFISDIAIPEWCFACLYMGRLACITCRKAEVCSVSLTVSQGEGLTVITITSNPKSRWPVLCQILGFLCYSPVCSVSQNMKGKLTNIHTALGVN